MVDEIRTLSYCVLLLGEIKPKPKENLMQKTLILTLIVALPVTLRAADHAEAPLVESDQAADIADVYTFLDPNDNSKVILAVDVHGFIVPGENGNLGGSADVSLLSRGRDTFAGYNIQMIALRAPAELLKGSAGNVIGVSATTLRRRNVHYSDKKDAFGAGNYAPIDRMGVPAINTALIPFARKNEYNRATPQDDAAGKFANDIVATLTALGTDATHIGILAGVAVTKGDMLRLDTSIANTGGQGGTNSG